MRFQFKCLFIMSLLCIRLLTNAHCDTNNSLGGSTNIEVAVTNVGPIVPGSLLRLTVSLKIEDAAVRKGLQAAESPWWNHVNIFFQELPETSLSTPQWYPIQDAGKFWRLKPVLENPMESMQSSEQKSDFLSKDFIAELHPAQVEAGTLYTLFAVLDIKEGTKQGVKDKSLFVSQVGVSLFQIQPQSMIDDKKTHVNFLTDKYYGELYRGNFSEAAKVNEEAVELGLDPIVAEFRVVDILLYQGKYKESLAQYEKVLQMDADAAKKNPQLERLVLPSTLATFRAKIQKKLQAVN